MQHWGLQDQDWGPLAFSNFQTKVASFYHVLWLLFQIALYNASTQNVQNSHIWFCAECNELNSCRCDLNSAVCLGLSAG